MEEGEADVVEGKARRRLGAVLGVAKEGMADMGKLGADLVVTAGMKGDVDKG